MTGYFKRTEKIIRDSAFDKMKKKPGLKLDPGLALAGVRTTGPREVFKKPMRYPQDRDLPIR